MRGVPDTAHCKVVTTQANLVEPAGRSGRSPCPYVSDVHALVPLSRRTFLSISIAALLVGCDSSDSSDSSASRRVMYARSGRGRRVSRAARIHNHNRRYATMAAAAADVPHPGDSSKIVTLDVSEETWNWYFGAGLEVIDLRWFQGLR